MLKEFKEFAMKGNVLDLAVAVIMGAAFGKIVSSFVSDILMPPLGVILGKVDFSNLYINLSRAQYSSLSEAKKAGAATINYGIFLNQVIDFSIVAFSIFLLVKAVTSLKKDNETPVVNTKECPFCFSLIPRQATRCAHCTSDLK